MLLWDTRTPEASRQSLGLLTLVYHFNDQQPLGLSSKCTDRLTTARHRCTNSVTELSFFAVLQFQHDGTAFPSLYHSALYTRSMPPKFGPGAFPQYTQGEATMAAAQSSVRAHFLFFSLVCMICACSSVTHSASFFSSWRALAATPPFSLLTAAFNAGCCDDWTSSLATTASFFFDGIHWMGFAEQGGSTLSAATSFPRRHAM